MGVRRTFALPLAQPLPPALVPLLNDIRLCTNRAVRAALEPNLTARGSLVPFAQCWARENRVHFAHARRATEVAVALLKGHRHRLRQGRRSSVPWVRQPFLLATGKTFHLDPVTGKVRLSLRPLEWCSFVVPLSDHHRAILATPGVRVKELQIRPDRVSLVVEKEVPEPYAPTSLLALDTNESSLDGVQVSAQGTTPVTVPFSEVRVVQQRHFERRRRLGRKKAHDRRVGRRLGRREGRREHNRVTQRLHRLSKQLVRVAAREHAVLALERLENLPVLRRRAPRTRRRLSSWPRRELHRQLFYKAEEQGVPVILVNPRNTSRTCPRCGAIAQRRSRVGTMFECGSCGWTLDRQLNAGANIARTVLAETRELGGLRVDLDALLEDVVRPLYATGSTGRARAERREGRRRRPT